MYQLSPEKNITNDAQVVTSTANGDNPRHTVDGGNPANHLGCKTP